MKKMVMSLVLAGTLFAAPSLADAALGDQTLRQGMNHSDVVELQDALKSSGHFSSSVNSTGFFGSITVSAVRDFQRANGLTVDGIVGPQTFRALGANGGSSSSSSSSSSSASSSSSSSAATSANFSRTLRQGSSGNDVRALQDALKSTGHFSSSVNSTGFYGSITVAAVRDFQRSNGLSVDGIAGPQTFGALGGSSSSGSSASSSQTSTRTTQTASASTSSASGQLSSVISTARSLTGSPYVWGGTTPRGFDCSGFIQYAFAQNGISVPRTTSQMWSATTRVSNPQPGDLVFFNTSGSGVSHAGIYIGNNQFIHSGSSTGVTVASMSNSYWAPRYLGAGRVR